MFDWTYLDRSGEEVGRSPRFPDADQAEDWIGASWPELLESGVEAVVLVDHGAGQGGGRNLYRMALGPE
jgi:hypothetical protein